MNNEKCPLCGSSIYISTNRNNYACSNPACGLYFGAREAIVKIDKILNMLKTE